MATQLDKILNFAESKLGSSYWYGYCQAFVARCYEAGTGEFISCESAKVSRSRFMKQGTQNDLCPPAGAAVYFYGDGERGKLYGHVALSAGNGVIYDPVRTIVKCSLTASMHNGYLGWGWLGGSAPEGATENNSSAAQPQRKKNEIYAVKTVSEVGGSGIRAADILSGLTNSGTVSILIQNGKKIFAPVVVGEVSLSVSRTPSAGILRFSVSEDAALEMENGCPVAMRYHGKPMFYGYIFEISRESGKPTEITCYDQLRYLKNKDSFIYSLSYSELLKFIAKKYHLKTGVIENTEYVIPTRVEEDTLLDILSYAEEQTEIYTGEIYVLYDDFGKLTLKNLRNMRTDALIEPECYSACAEKSGIDKDVYNRVVVARDDAEQGVRELYIANDAQNQIKWGVLQLYEKAGRDDTAQDAELLAQAKLKEYNAENKTLSVKNCIGNPAVRGGSLVLMRRDRDGSARYMICEKAEHIFCGNEHFMNLELSGGEFHAGR